MTGRYGHLAERLEDIAEEIADLAIEELKDAVRSSKGRPVTEKQLTQARRAIEKAVHLLRAADAGGEAPDGFDD